MKKKPTVDEVIDGVEDALVKLVGQSWLMQNIAEEDGTCRMTLTIWDCKEEVYEDD